MTAYLRILIAERLRAWNPMSRQKAGQSKTKAVLGFVGYCVLLLMLYGMLVGLEVGMFYAFRQIGQPETMLGLVLILCTFLTLFTSFFFVLSSLFFSRDVEFVSSLPISSRTLLAARLIMIGISEAGIALAVCLPAVLMYGITQGMNWLFYIKALLAMPFIPLAPITLVALLSFLLIRISALWKRREALTTVMSFLFLALYFWFIMKLNMSSHDSEMPAAILQFITQQKQTLDLLAGIYPPVQWLCTSLLGSGVSALGYWLAFAALNAAALGLGTLLLGGSYQRLAIKQTETLAKINAKARRRGSEGVRTPFQALYRREVKEIFTTPVYATNCLSGAVVMPLMVLLMSMGQWQGTQNVISGLNALAALISPSLYRAVATALMAFGSSMCMAVGTAVSREGKRHDFYKMLPVPVRTLLSAKLCMGLTMNVVCVLPVAVLLGIFLPALIPQTLVAYVVGLLFATANDCFSLWLDARRPKLGWKTETEAIKQNTNGVISMFVSMGLVAVLCGGYYGLSRLGLSGDATYAVLCGVLAVITALLYRLLMTHGANAYLLQESGN